MTSPFILKEHKYTKQADLGHYSPVFLEIDFGQAYAWEIIIIQSQINICVQRR